MRKINKGEPLSEFVDFKKKNPSANWRNFHEDAKDVYVSTREQILIDEQNCLCGYTEIPINDITDAHLDHYLKRDISAKDMFNWDNLIAATNDSDFGAHHKDTVYRIKKEEYQHIFNPVEEAVEDYFDYNLRGEIAPKRELNAVLKAKVEKTVEIFNLQHETLRRRRENIIRQINAYKDLPKEDIRRILSPLGFVSVVYQFTE
jgi:uncharacterized protein (TIGR02646 family)